MDKATSIVQGMINLIMCFWAWRLNSDLNQAQDTIDALVEELDLRELNAE